jgi:hypothetical protein
MKERPAWAVMEGNTTGHARARMRRYSTAAGITFALVPAGQQQKYDLNPQTHVLNASTIENHSINQLRAPHRGV